MKIISVGDIHGNNKVIDIFTDDIIKSYDKFVFVGDYVDSFKNYGIENELKILNFLVNLKKKYPEKIVLLLGNHDVQYIHNDVRHLCSGFCIDKFIGLNTFFNDNKKYFTIAYKYKNYLWTHAGVSKDWYKRHFIHELSRIGIKDEKEIYDNIDVYINLLYKNYTPKSCIYDISKYYRDGRDDYGGPLWMDINEFIRYENSINLKQIVGHTQTPCIKTIDDITFIDCFSNKEQITINDCYLLEIKE